jgi:hypothetical protein
VNLTTDTYYRSIATGFVAPHLPESQRQNEVVVDAVVATVSAFARGGYDVVVDGVVGPWFLEPFRRAAARESLDLSYAVLRPTLDVTLGRAKGRDVSELRDAAAVTAVHRAFAVLGDVEGHALDTTGQTPHETADAVRAGLEAGRFRLATDVQHPDDTRTEPPLRADELSTLRGFLDFHRQTLRWKTTGLTADQLRTAVPPSDMTLGGLIKHLAYVESHWFSHVLRDGATRPPFDDVDWDADADWDWHSAADDSPETLHTLFDEAVAASDRDLEAALATGGLDQLSVHESRRYGGGFSLRWILGHMIEEYARHNGHADLIRETLDGMTGE